MPLIQRLVDISFTLGQGNFTESRTNQVTISGLRVSAKIVKAGGNSMGEAQLLIYGMTLSLMNQLSTLGMIYQLVQRNLVTITAGDNQNGMGTVFVGTITNAFADFQASPDVPFHVMAHAGMTESVLSIPPSSFSGSSDVATIMSGLAAQAGLKFENNGVSAKLSNPYFSGSVRSQIKDCADHANIKWTIDNGTLAIWPKTGSRGGSVPLISPDTGLISYPAYTHYGLLLKTLFNPSIGFGGKVQVKSNLFKADGTYIVLGITHDLSSMVPKGPWFSELSLYNPAYPTPAI
jgi:hypothetical protein